MRGCGRRKQWNPCFARARSPVLGHTAEGAPTTCRSEPMVMVLSSAGLSFPSLANTPEAAPLRRITESCRTELDRTLGNTNWFSLRRRNSAARIPSPAGCLQYTFINCIGVMVKHDTKFHKMKSGIIRGGLYRKTREANQGCGSISAGCP